MGERPMTSAEEARLRGRLSEAKGKREQLSLLIAGMEKDLQRGTIWQYDLEAFKEMCAEVEESARRDEERFERWEIARYGRVLTHEERQGCVSPVFSKPSADEEVPDGRSIGE